MRKRYLELRYRAEIFTQFLLSKVLGYVFFVFRYFHPGLLHGRREGHPHEAHQEDEKSIKLDNIHMFYA